MEYEGRSLPRWWRFGGPPVGVVVYYYSTYYKAVRVGGRVIMEDMYYGVCVFITAVPNTKLFAWGEGDSGGHVL
jgi:hypothetical protein